MASKKALELRKLEQDLVEKSFNSLNKVEVLNINEKTGKKQVRITPKTKYGASYDIDDKKVRRNG